MPSMSTDLESRLLDALRPLIQEIKAEAKRELIASLGGTSVPVVSVPDVASLPARRVGRPARVARSNRHIPPHCVYPSCNKPSKGPRFSFMCEEHIGTPKKDKAKYLAAWKQGNSAT
jgi:hypothetical protein